MISQHALKTRSEKQLSLYTESPLHLGLQNLSYETKLTFEGTFCPLTTHSLIKEVNFLD